MSIKKIIPCLDVKGGRVVKGVKFVDFVDAGDPVEFAKYYASQGADELVFLDITATKEQRRTILDVAERTAAAIDIPLAVGGGIRTIEDFYDILSAGASKVSVNSAAVADKTLISRAAEHFGSKCVVVAIDVTKVDGRYHVLVAGGSKDTGIDALEWAAEVEKLGAGEILLTSLDADGTKDGYDLEITRAVADRVSIPVTASGGCGKLEDFYDALTKGGAQAALAASLFHFRELTVRQVKEYLRSRGVEVNL